MSHVARRVTAAGTALALALALLAALAAPAEALSPRIDEREPVFGGLVHERFTVRLGDGAVARGNVLRIDTGAEHLTLRPQLARDRIAGLERMVDLDRRARNRGALAGTNGGYWLQTPTGAPNGLYVEDGRALAGDARLGRSGNRRSRSAAGFLPGGEVVLDFLPVDLSLRTAAGTLEVDDLNRSSRPNADDGEVFVYDERYGRPVEVPSGSLLVRLDALEARVGGEAAATVRSVARASSSGETSVAAGESVLLATGGRAGEAALAGLEAGAQVALTVTVRPEATSPAAWAEAAEALPGGPLIVRDGSRTSVDSWRREAFSEAHLTGRQPRTAVARAGDEVLLITVDGRRAGHSVGMTLIELARLSLALGATDTLNLDGGGSTTMLVEGQITNRPSETGRSVANGLFVFSDYPFDGSGRLAGADRYATAARIARSSHGDGAEEVVLATGEGFPDALAGGPLAAALDAPLLLTRGDRLPEPTATALVELGVERVTLLGGPAAISRSVEGTLSALGLEVRRIAGAERYATATAIAEAVADEPALERVFLTAGRDFPDALAAAAPAGAMGAPVLLTESAALPEATASYLAGRDVDEVVVVGGTSAVAEAVATRAAELTGGEVRRLAGADRYATAATLNTWAAGELPDHDPRRLVVAQGRNFPDALAGGPYAAARSDLLMIVPPDDVEASAAAVAYLEGLAPTLERVVLLGGRSVLTDYQRYQLDQYAVR